MDDSLLPISTVMQYLLSGFDSGFCYFDFGSDFGFGFGFCSGFDSDFGFDFDSGSDFDCDFPWFISPCV
ncbi:MAG: hypothetical protein J6B09_04500 [Clostridia bacterium]|nr:hypothetical protein [Clostridia bacterium]MBQ8717412.1 hypothetical protein [Clostridia bacterium]